MSHVRNFINFIKDRPEYIGLLGVIVTIIGTLVPNIYIANMPMSYIEGDGKFIALAMVIVAFLVYRKKAIASLLPTGFACILLVIYFYNTSPVKAASLGLFKIATYGPGTYLMIIGLCLCLAYGVFGRNIEKEKPEITFNWKYYLASLILPIMGIYWYVVNKNKNNEISANSIRGARLGILLFLITVLIYTLMS